MKGDLTSTLLNYMQWQVQHPVSVYDSLLFTDNTFLVPFSFIENSALS